jgi:hypothetical protein
MEPDNKTRGEKQLDPKQFQTLITQLKTVLKGYQRVLGYITHDFNVLNKLNMKMTGAAKYEKSEYTPETPKPTQGPTVTNNASQQMQGRR